MSCCVSYLTLLMTNIKNRKKLQLIQTIWNVMLYSQHFTFHWKLLGLVSRIEKSSTGDNNFGKWKGTFRFDRPKWPDRLQQTAFKAGPEYSSRTKPKWTIPFDESTEISGLLGWMESALWVRCMSCRSWHFVLIYLQFYSIVDFKTLEDPRPNVKLD